MVPLQRFADGHTQDGGKDQSHNSVEDSGGELGDDSGHCGGRGQALQEKAVIEVALGKVENGVGYGTGGGCQDGLAVAPVVFGLQNHQTHHQAVGTLGQEGDPAFADVQGIGHIVDGGAEAGGQTAQPRAKQEAAEGAHDVAQMEGGVSADIDGQGDPQSGTGNGQSSQQCGEDQMLCGDGLLFHNSFLPEIDDAIITATGHKKSIRMKMKNRASKS